MNFIQSRKCRFILTAALSLLTLNVFISQKTSLDNSAFSLEGLLKISESYAESQDSSKIRPLSVYPIDISKLKASGLSDEEIARILYMEDSK